jgi:formylglycine-generating enzyme required for sulfatase activity
MEPITTALIASSLAAGFAYLGEQLVGKTLLDPLLDPVAEQLRGYLPQKLRRKDERALQEAVENALHAAGAPTGDDDAVQRWLKGVSLDRLVATGNDALRRLTARTLLTFTDATLDPPEELLIALGWPRSRKRDLAMLLTTLRMHLATVDAWRPLIAYADSAANRTLLQALLTHLARLDAVFVATPAGEALRVIVVQQQMSEQEATTLEERYRADLVQDLQRHDFRGIYQVRKDTRLPLADVYLELGLLTLTSEDERREAQARLLTLRDHERAAEEERRLDDRVTDALARAQRLVILGEPGAGKTISLRFIALMAAYGYGISRLGLSTPLLPIMIRLADFARALQATPTLALETFLMQAVEQQFPHPRLGEFLRLAFDKGACLLLLDGLDEVGDDPVQGVPLRTQVVKAVQRLGDRRCGDGRGNRLVVTSRIEGYWPDPLRDFHHVQLSPLRPPDEIEAFLLRWYTAHELADAKTLPDAVAEARAAKRVGDLLPRILTTPSVRRLATNPLLLTILALIHENVGRLPNRRIELYEICAQTLIESWRAAQTDVSSELLAEVGKAVVIRIMAPLAYWLHEENPGGTASFAVWRTQLVNRLEAEGFETEATALADRFLHYARHSAGLLAERGLGQIGFFHLTFEEYLAAREIARQRSEERRAMLKRHWEDPRWREVILLAAGQLGIAESKTDDVSDYLEDLLKMEPVDPANEGRQVVLAGRALADMGAHSVTRRTRQWVREALVETMQDLDPITKQPNHPPRLPVRTRYEAGETLDELGWLPPDLDAWVHCPATADNGADLLAPKYPITNTQFARFVESDGYTNPLYWGGEESKGWRWRMEKHSESRGKEPITQPRFWDDVRFGRERRGYPVVDVSWYEASAFAAWLTALVQRVREGDGTVNATEATWVEVLVKAGVTVVRLPTEEEWERLAGGVADENRYPWDPPQGPATTDKEAILARANTNGSAIGGTSPVAMYPLGYSQPYKLADIAGNVACWTDTWDDTKRVIKGRTLCGGSWYDNIDNARCIAHNFFTPDNSDTGFGCWVVAPIGSDC